LTIEIEEDSPIAVRWRLLGIPHPSGRELPIQPPLRFTLIINTIEPNNPLQEDVKLGMGRGVFGDFEQWLEDIYHVSLGHTTGLQELTPDDILEVVH
jgi:hypothetical protein